MSQHIEVIVIAPNSMKELGTALSEQITAIKGFKSVCYDLKSFIDKPPQERPARFFISLGDERENSFTKQALPLMVEFSTDEGSCIALNHNTVLIFGETDYRIGETFKDLGLKCAETGIEITKKLTSTVKSMPDKIFEVSEGLKNFTSSAMQIPKNLIEKDCSNDAESNSISAESVLSNLSNRETWCRFGPGESLQSVSELIFGGVPLLKFYHDKQKAKSKRAITHAAVGLFMEKCFEQWIKHNLEK